MRRSWILAAIGGLAIAAVAGLAIVGCGDGSEDIIIPQGTPQQTLESMVSALDRGDEANFKLCFIPSQRPQIRPDHIERGKGFCERGRPFDQGKIDWSTGTRGTFQGHETLSIEVELQDPNGRPRTRRLTFMKMGRNWQLKDIWM